MFDAPQIIIRFSTGRWQFFLRFLRWFPDLLKRNTGQFPGSRVAEDTGLLVFSSCRFRLLQHTGVNSPGFILSPICSPSSFSMPEIRNPVRQSVDKPDPPAYNVLSRDPDRQQAILHHEVCLETVL